jgi:hypothetical protein
MRLGAQIFANGPAIWGGCVPPAGGWRAFCCPGTNFVAYTSVAIQALLRAGNNSRYGEFYWK